LTEIYNDDSKVGARQYYAKLPNRDEALKVVAGTGAEVMVADFGNTQVSDSDSAFRNWRQLGNTSFYALRLVRPSELPNGRAGILPQIRP